MNRLPHPDERSAAARRATPTNPPSRPGTKAVRLPDGRSLAYLESGDPRGAPVFAFHGLPGSRLQRHPDESIARAARLRVIHVDRPGYGLSVPQPGRTIADFAKDIAVLADALVVERFAVVGVSGGGPYAVACAATLGARVTRAAIVSSVGPPGTMEGRMVLAARLGFFLARRARWTLKLPIAMAARFALGSPIRFVGVVSSYMAPADRPILARPDVRAMLARDLREAFRQGVDATISDIALFGRPWALPIDRIACPVALWHGEDDCLVPPSATRYLARMINGAQVRMLPREGHFLVFERWPEICAWLAE